MKNIFHIISLAILTSSCSGFLDEKPSKDIVIPSSLQDLQAMLDYSLMNISSGISDIGTDDVVTSQAGLSGLYNPITEGNAYLWKSDILEGLLFSDWQNGYSTILQSNIVLDQLKEIPISESNKNEWNNIKGSALFYRAYIYHDLLGLFAPQYDRLNAPDLPGIPLRNAPEIINEVERSPLESCYNQIFTDLNEALELLPELPLEYPTRPSKLAVYGLLARVALQMGQYEMAEGYARACLEIRSELIDYNALNPNSSFPFPKFNPEVIFHSMMNSYSYLFSPLFYIDSELINTYKAGDLRKNLLFRPAPMDSSRFNFRGNYTGSSEGFNGISLDEIYLILSEVLVRMGETEEGVNVLNQLLVSRWDTASFDPVEVSDSEETLARVLLERRKTLIFRGRRWDDLRRLNKDLRFQKTLLRELNGEFYSLPPNDNRYVYPIPENELSFNPIPQNPR